MVAASIAVSTTVLGQDGTTTPVIGAPASHGPSTELSGEAAFNSALVIRLGPTQSGRVPPPTLPSEQAVPSRATERDNTVTVRVAVASDAPAAEAVDAQLTLSLTAEAPTPAFVFVSSPLAPRWEPLAVVLLPAGGEVTVPVASSAQLAALEGLAVLVIAPGAHVTAAGGCDESEGSSAGVQAQTPTASPAPIAG